MKCIKRFHLFARSLLVLVICIVCSSATLVAQQALQWVFPNQDDTVSGQSVLLWALEAQPFVSSGNVVFDVCDDALCSSFVELVPQTAPDFGPGSHTSALDTTAFGNGDLFLRARFRDRNRPITGPVIRVTVANQSGPMDYAPVPAATGCYCTGMTIKNDPSQLTTLAFDNRGRPPSWNQLPDPGGKAPLGPDPDYYSYNFEVVATVLGKPDACKEGQTAKASFTGKPPWKSFCAGYLEPFITCVSPEGCPPFYCVGGSYDGLFCKSKDDIKLCTSNSGKCVGRGTCKMYPFDGKEWGDDDYKDTTYPNKKHFVNNDGTGGTIVWDDLPGASRVRHDQRPMNYVGVWDFISEVRGSSDEKGTNKAETCRCHYQLQMEWDPQNKVYKNTVLKPVADDPKAPNRNSLNCTLPQ